MAKKPLVFQETNKNWWTDMNNCAICETVIYHPHRYFCKNCYFQFRDDIRKKKKWTQFVVSEEAKRRRREIRDSAMLIYLGSKWDVDLNRNLVYREGFYG